MSLRVDLFCEDAAHEAVARATVERVAREEETEITIRVGSARAGLGRLQRELRAFREATRIRAGAPDILVVVADANSDGPQARRREVEDVGLEEIFPARVIGTPDPCVEAWLLSDRTFLAGRFGRQLPSTRPHDCDELKASLDDLLQSAGEIVTQGGAEFADEIIGGMSWYRAGRTEPTLKRFVDDLRAELRSSPSDARKTAQSGRSS